MKKKILCKLAFFCVLGLQAQNLKCGAQEANDKILDKFPESVQERVDFEKFTQNFSKGNMFHSQKNATYIIPVVVHLYGESHNGKLVDQQKIETVIQKVNEDLNGLNADYNTVDPDFMSIRSTISVELRLAKLDPNGNVTSGVVFHEYKGGYGNIDATTEAQIAVDAWDNTKYMNIYIQNILYDDNDTFNSGVAWYPNSSMTSSNLARVVYNGAYLHGNTDDEFASSMTHEVGHWLNLIHTFQGGCTMPNDNVTDTPAEDGPNALTCTGGTNCLGEKVNVENYMGYSGAGGCYKMFTQGQVSRMLAALQHPARITLWQASNLETTGVSDSNPVTITATNTGFVENLANEGVLSLTGENSSMASTTIALTGTTFAMPIGSILTEGTHYTHTFPSGITPLVTVTSNSEVTIVLEGAATNHEKLNSIGASTFTFLNSAISGGVTSVTTPTISFSIAFKDAYGIFTDNLTNIAVNATNNWKYFTLDPIINDNAYGAWSYQSGHLKVETYYKGLVCQSGTRNISLLDGCDSIDMNSNFVFPGSYPNQLDLAYTGYGDWVGQTGYIGFRVRIEGYRCHGFMHVSVTSDGLGYTITDYGYNTEPFAPIVPDCALNNNSYVLDDNLFAVGPNPFEDYISIRTKDTPIKRVEIYDMLGKKMGVTNFQLQTSEEYQVATSNLHSGIYLIKIIDIQDFIVIKKVIKR